MHGVDCVALGFVRRPEDILDGRRYIQQVQAELGQGSDQAPLPLIAKLEKPEAVAHLDEILNVVDGVIVARGELGVEMAPEKVPPIQKRGIGSCNDLVLPVTTATQIL